MDNNNNEIETQLLPGVPVLLEWLAAHNLTSHGWALSHGLDPSTVHKLIRGKQGASLGLAVKIQDATGGAVQARLWQKNGEGK